jgi:hypothetical protein
MTGIKRGSSIVLNASTERSHRTLPNAMEMSTASARSGKGTTLEQRKGPGPEARQRPGSDARLHPTEAYAEIA